MIKEIHRNLIQGLEKALHKTFFVENRYADKVLERTLKFNKKWGARDRGFVAMHFYEIVRWKSKLEFFANVKMTEDNIYNIIATHFLLNKIDLPPIPEFSKIYVKKIKTRFQESYPSLAIKHSIPEWMGKLFVEEIGKDWEKEIKALNIPAQTVLRVNTLKTNKKELIERLAEENIEVELIEGYTDALTMISKRNIFKYDPFKEGLFEVQDASSQLVSAFVDPKPGSRVIDACAGAGGKTLHLASLMNNKGNIIALDIHEWKLNNLKQRARRNGAHNIQTKLIEDSKTLKRLENSADYVLIDAPCSGLGVLKRNPDAKWKLQPDFIERIKKDQEEIFNNNSKLVKKDGVLVYATCSILSSENREQVDKFLSTHSEFKLIDEKIIMPSQTEFDGFYMAKLKRIN